MIDKNFAPASSISTEAKEYFLENFTCQSRDSQTYPDASDLEGWVAYNETELVKRLDYNHLLMERFKPRLEESDCGEVPVADFRPQGWVDNGKVLVYTHGGCFVGGTATDALDSILPLAQESGLRVISISYTLAPHKQFEGITDEVVSVIQALLSKGYSPGDIALLGDSAGANIAAASTLKLRDTVGILPAVIALWSPWLDFGCSGDTYLTLAESEPFFTYDNLLSRALACYVGDGNRLHPYASPLFADFTRGFPPTLLQCGTRELFLSDSVRMYRRLISSNLKAELDIYEGMWHVFQFKPIDTPEAKLARNKTSAFIKHYLGV